jgi:hypothetical protein
MTEWERAVDIFRHRGKTLDISGLATEALAYLIPCCVGYELEGRRVPWEQDSLSHSVSAETKGAESEQATQVLLV